MLLKGDLDLESAPALRACLVEFAEKNVTLDFSDVTFMDSTAMGVLLTGHQRSTLTGTRITIQGVQPGQLRLFELMGLLDQLNVDRDGPRKSRHDRPRSDVLAHGQRSCPASVNAVCCSTATPS